MSANHSNLPKKRRWLQFSVRTVFILTALVATALGVRRQYVERHAVTGTIVRVDGSNVEAGHITFMRRGDFQTVEIKNGRFDAELLPGEYSANGLFAFSIAETEVLVEDVEVSPWVANVFSLKLLPFGNHH